MSSPDVVKKKKKPVVVDDDDTVNSPDPPASPKEKKKKKKIPVDSDDVDAPPTATAEDDEGGKRIKQNKLTDIPYDVDDEGIKSRLHDSKEGKIRKKKKKSAPPPDEDDAEEEQRQEEEAKKKKKKKKKEEAKNDENGEDETFAEQFPDAEFKPVSFQDLGGDEEEQPTTKKKKGKAKGSESPVGNIETDEEETEKPKKKKKSKKPKEDDDDGENGEGEGETTKPPKEDDEAESKPVRDPTIRADGKKKLKLPSVNKIAQVAKAFPSQLSTLANKTKQQIQDMRNKSTKPAEGGETAARPAAQETKSTDNKDKDVDKPKAKPVVKEQPKPSKQDEDDEDEDERPKQKSKKPPNKPISDEDDEDEEEEEDEKPTKKKPAKTKPKPKPKDSEEEEEDEEPKPKAKPKASASSATGSKGTKSKPKDEEDSVDELSAELGAKLKIDPKTKPSKPTSSTTVAPPGGKPVTVTAAAPVAATVVAAAVAAKSSSSSSSASDSKKDGKEGGRPPSGNAKADKFVEEADKILKKFSLFNKREKYEDALKELEKASAEYKLTKNWGEAAEVFLRMGEIYDKKLKGYDFEVTDHYTKAAKCYAYIDENLASKYYKLAIEKHKEKHEFNVAGRLYKEIGEMEEKNGNKKAAIEAYEAGAKCHDAEDKKAYATQLRTKIAQLSAASSDYGKALLLFERMAREGLDSNRNKVTVKENYFKALLCHLVTCAPGFDMTEVTEALEEYKASLPLLEGSAEGKFIEDLATHFTNDDIDKFDQCVAKYDRLYKMDNWSHGVVEEVKQILLKGPTGKVAKKKTGGKDGDQGGSDPDSDGDFT